MPHQHEIMTIEEVAAYLRISERTVYDWANKGEIPCGKLGTSWRFKKSEIQRWVDERLDGAVKERGGRRIPLDMILTPNRVLILEDGHKKNALHALADLLATAPEVTDAEDLTKGLARREELMSTGMGSGIAVPHVRLDSVKDLVMAVGVCKEGIPDYESIDGQPVRIVMMVAAAKNQHAQYLSSLSFICTKLKNEALRDALLDAETTEEVYRLLMER
jgi:nitrogen PTS system EIIA component